MRVLILGATGMLGNTMLRLFAQSNGFEVFGTARSTRSASHLSAKLQPRIISGVDAENQDSLVCAIADTKPQAVINCIGLVKQLAGADDPLVAIPINTLFPHRLAQLCRVAGARLIHFSTDCVFSGQRGSYTETDQPDAGDLYGRSKLLGEVDYDNAITLRTSIIGRELHTVHGLIDWFLSQSGRVSGYTHAIFSGLPTVELARVIRDIVITRPDLHGLYHLSSAPIAKYDLLKLVAEIYRKEIEIIPDNRLKIDRSLDSTRFRNETGYSSPSWSELIQSMCSFG